LCLAVVVVVAVVVVLRVNQKEHLQKSVLH